jgi:type II secretory pathway predicted ATPase ExeA
MLSDVKEYYGLARDLGKSGYFETVQSQQTFKELRLAIKDGKLVALSGIVGSGKSMTLQRIQDTLIQEKEILVAKSLAIEKSKITLATLMMALFLDLATDKDGRMPTQTERRERALLELIRKRHKPIALFIDEAHDLHAKTLIGLKRLIEVVRNGGGTLSVVLAGHPKLKNDLSRPSMEEIGARATVFDLEPLGPERLKYINWLIGQALTAKVKVDALITTEALALLSEQLTTPLQFEQYLTRAFEEAYKIGQKPVGTDIVESVLAPDIDALDARLVRNGYNVKNLCELLNSKPREINAFIRGQLPPERTQQLSSQLLAVGVPL